MMRFLTSILFGGQPKRTLALSGAPAAANVGGSTAFNPTIYGGTSPYSLSVLTGSLPAGRSISGLGVTGTYTAAASYSYTLRVTDAVGATADLAISETVAALGPYLATVGSAPLAVWGMRRMVAAYNGPLYQLTRVGGAGGTMDVSPKSGSDLPDYTAIAAWASGYQGVVVSKRYDQSGNGHDQAPAGNAPSFDVTDAPTGCVPAFFANADLTASIVLNRNNVTVVQATQMRAALEPNQGLWSLNSAGSLVGMLYYGNGAYSPRYYSPASGDMGSANDAATAMRANPIGIAFTSNGTERRFFSQGTSSVMSASGGETSGPADAFAEGVGNFSGGWHGNHRSWGTVIYPALSQVDAATAISSINSIYAIPTSFTSRIVAQGDSIEAGTYITSNRSYRIALAKPQVEVFNVAIGGSLLKDQAIPSALFTSAYGTGKCILILQGGTNDFAQTGSPSGYSAYNANGNPTGAAVYSIMQAKVSAGKTAGFVAVSSDTLPRKVGVNGWTNGTVSTETERLSYNTAMNSGSGGGADAFVKVSDTATMMGALAAVNDSTLYTDGLHPSNLGESYLTPEYLAASVIAAL